MKALFPAGVNEYSLPGLDQTEKKRKPWKCLLCSTHMWVVESVYNLLPFFDRHRSIKTNILVPMQRKKNHIVWKLICNYSLEYLFLFVLCTLFVLLIDIYNKQTNNEKSKNDRDLALFRMLCDICFQYFYYFFFSFSVFGNLILNTLKNKKKWNGWALVRSTKGLFNCLRDWPKDCSYLKNRKRILIAGDKRRTQS